MPRYSLFEMYLLNTKTIVVGGSISMKIETNLKQKKFKIAIEFDTNRLINQIKNIFSSSFVVSD